MDWRISEREAEGPKGKAALGRMVHGGWALAHHPIYRWKRNVGAVGEDVAGSLESDRHCGRRRADGGRIRRHTVELFRDGAELEDGRQSGRVHDVGDSGPFPVCEAPD